MHEKATRQPQATTRSSSLRSWILYCLAAPAAAMQAISVNSLFANQPAVGALQAFGLFAALAIVPAWLLAPKDARHTFFSRRLMAFSSVAVLCVFVMQGKVAQLQAAGGTTATVAFAPTLVVLLVQLCLAAIYLIRARRKPLGHDRGGSTVSVRAWGPVVLFVPLLLIGGFAGSALFGSAPTTPSVDGSSSSSVDSSPQQSRDNSETGQEKYSRFPKPEDFTFAKETARAGADFGGDFVHYYTDQRPLLGFTFSNRDWHRRGRLSKDFRGVFDRDAPMDGELVLMADPGYVVAGLQAQVDKHVHAIRVLFAPLDELGLDMVDSEWSAWTDGYDATLPVTELGGTGDLVLGVTGTAGLVVNSLGLMMDASAPAEALHARGNTH